MYRAVKTIYDQYKQQPQRYKLTVWSECSSVARYWQETCLLASESKRLIEPAKFPMATCETLFDKLDPLQIVGVHERTTPYQLTKNFQKGLRAYGCDIGVINNYILLNLITF